jgi:hypothetical protein
MFPKPEGLNIELRIGYKSVLRQILIESLNGQFVVECRKEAIIIVWPVRRFYLLGRHSTPNRSSIRALFNILLINGNEFDSPTNPISVWVRRESYRLFGESESGIDVIVSNEMRSLRKRKRMNLKDFTFRLLLESI